MFWIALKIALIYTLNGLLAFVWWLLDHWPALVSLALAGVCLLLVDGHLARGAGQRRLRHARGTVQLARAWAVPSAWIPALLWTLTAWLLPPPVPYIGALMWLAALVVPLSLPFEKRFLVHRLRWFIALYAALGLGFLLLARYPLTFAQAAAWSQRLQAAGSGEALEWVVRAQFIPYLALILWVVYPVTYFGYVGQQLFNQRRLLVAPWQSVATRMAVIRARGEHEGPTESRTWLRRNRA